MIVVLQTGKYSLTLLVRLIKDYFDFLVCIRDCEYSTFIDP